MAQAQDRMNDPSNYDPNRPATPANPYEQNRYDPYGQHRDHGRSRSGYEDGRSADEIQRSINHTRSAMDRTIDELGYRLRPRNLLDEAMCAFRSQARSAGSSAGATVKNATRTAAKTAGVKIWDQIKHHPLPSALVGAGLVWMMMEDKDKGHNVFVSRRHALGTRTSFEPHAYGAQPYGDVTTIVDMEACEEDEGGPGMTERARERMARARESTAGAMSGARERVSGAMHSVGDSARDVMHSAGESARGAMHSAGEAVGSMTESARYAAWKARQRAAEAGERAREMAAWSGHRVKSGVSMAGDQVYRGYRSTANVVSETASDYPLAVGAAVMAAGVIAGLMAPRTRREDEWMGEYSDELKDLARHRGREWMEHGKEIAGATASTVTEEAHRQGIAPGDLADKAKRVAQEAKETAKAEVKQHGREMKGESRSGMNQTGGATAGDTATGPACPPGM